MENPIKMDDFGGPKTHPFLRKHPTKSMGLDGLDGARVEWPNGAVTKTTLVFVAVFWGDENPTQFI